MSRVPRSSLPEEELMTPGHMGCLGCGACNAMRYVMKALGDRTIVTVPACCWAIMSGAWPNATLKVPFINVAFETTGAAVSGVRAALNVLGKEDVNVLGFAGDGGTFDIGIQALSGAVERGTDMIYVCYDNEAYMNTGIQRSGSTPYGAWTTTTPVGTTRSWKTAPKKNFMDIMVAHEIPYAAVGNVAYPEDLVKKVKKAVEVKGPAYLQVYCPCPTGWRSNPKDTIEIAKLAVSTCIYPMYEVAGGKYVINRKPKDKVPVFEYLKLQGRFRHLPEEEVERIQKDTDRHWDMLLRKEEFTKDL